MKGDSFEYENLKVSVSDTDAHRVKFAVVEKSEQPEPEEEGRIHKILNTID